jgi:hypothetical protein
VGQESERVGQDGSSEGTGRILDEVDGAQTGKDIMVIKWTSEDATEGRSSDETIKALEDYHEEQRRTGGSRREGR